jgi:hypothetical protein
MACEVLEHYKLVRYFYHLIQNLFIKIVVYLFVTFVHVIIVNL